MIHIIKNYKWVIASSLICVGFGLLTFFTFINQSFISLNNLNLQILLIVDLTLLVLFFLLVIYKIYNILKELIAEKKISILKDGEPTADLEYIETVLPQLLFENFLIASKNLMIIG